MEDLLTLSECQEVITNSSNGLPSSVISYEIRPVGDQVMGFLGEYFRLIVQVEQNAKVTHRSFFLKSLPRSDLDTRKMMEKGGMFGKEVKIYGELFSKWPQSGDNFDALFKWRPECYYTRSDLIVLEELDADYRHIAFGGHFDLKHCQEMLKALAKMHASSINFEKKELKGEKLDKFYSHLLFEVAMERENAWFNAGLELIYFIAKSYEDQFQGVNIPAKDLFMKKLYDVFNYRDEVNDFDKVLCHRDLWHSNMFFKYSEDKEPEHCILIDFQISHYHSPVMDLLISIYVSTRRKFRDEELGKCFKFYLEYFENVLKETFKFPEEEVKKLQFFKETEFEMLRKHYKFYALVINCIFIPLTQLKPGTLNSIQNNDPGKYFRICNVSRNEFTKENMEKDQFYKDYVLEAVRELVEYLFK